MAESMSEDMYMVSEALGAFLTYILVVLRCGCLVMYSPFFSSEAFFQQARIALAIAFPLVIVPFATQTAEVPRVMEMQHLFLLAGQEFSLGIAIAFLSSLIFLAVQMAGEIAGQQIGFSMAQTVDPSSGIESPMLGMINMNLTLSLFLSSKLYLILIYLFARSYEWLPIGFMLPELNLKNPVLEMGVIQATEVISLGLRMSMPIILIMLMCNIITGFITKTMPQMNIQVLNMPLKIVLGLFMLIFIYPATIIMLVPHDWSFNLVDMPEGPLGEMLLEMSEMIRDLGEGSRAAAAGR